ncbi:MAG TPA: hypothetical protein P5119_03375 [Candidatus Aminicenantes bacterium]|nr:hypothetical protein [Candidatus Aminicenantes bacterium]HRY64364.1 hypothetical protein [Candidatus Aminicenantes bacterium]HRZ71277.1 hypothetical protein [Candidatus Aminicenantes bacterium]
MNAKKISILALTLLAAGTVACYHPYGSRLYPDRPRFRPSDPAAVELIRREPRRDHIQLGEVWIRPTWRMDRFFVEGVLREKAAAMGADALVIVADRFFREGVVFSYWHGPRTVYERQIVGVAIRFRR